MATQRTETTLNSEHFLHEIELLFASNRKVLEPTAYRQLAHIARDRHSPHADRAMRLVLQAA